MISDSGLFFGGTLYTLSTNVTLLNVHLPYKMATATWTKWSRWRCHPVWATEI